MLLQSPRESLKLQGLTLPRICCLPWTQRQSTNPSLDDQQFHLALTATMPRMIHRVLPSMSPRRMLKTKIKSRSLPRILSRAPGRSTKKCHMLQYPTRRLAGRLIRSKQARHLIKYWNVCSSGAIPLGPISSCNATSN